MKNIPCKNCLIKPICSNEILERIKTLFNWPTIYVNDYVAHIVLCTTLEESLIKKCNILYSFLGCPTKTFSEYDSEKILEVFNELGVTVIVKESDKT